MKKKIELKNLWVDPRELQKSPDTRDCFIVHRAKAYEGEVQCTLTVEIEVPEPVLTVTPKQLEEMLHAAGYTLGDAGKAGETGVPDYNEIPVKK